MFYITCAITGTGAGSRKNPPVPVIPERSPAPGTDLVTQAKRLVHEGNVVYEPPPMILFCLGVDFGAPASRRRALRRPWGAVMSPAAMRDALPSGAQLDVQ